jgi:hypothetical protein
VHRHELTDEQWKHSSRIDLAGGQGSVGIRPESTMSPAGTATIDVKVPGVPIIKIKVPKK